MPPHTSDSLCCFDAPRNTTVLNSKVISVTVKPPPRSLLTPLEIEFAHMYNVSAAHVCGGARAPLLVLSAPRPVHSSQVLGLQEEWLSSEFQVRKLSLRAPRATQQMDMDAELFSPCLTCPLTLTQCLHSKLSSPEGICLTFLVPMTQHPGSCVTGHLSPNQELLPSLSRLLGTCESHLMPEFDQQAPSCRAPGMAVPRASFQNSLGLQTTTAV